MHLSLKSFHATFLRRHAAGVAVLLMPGFGLPECARRFERRDNVKTLLAQGLDQPFGNGALRFALVKDRGAVLPAFVTAINGRIVDFKKKLCELLKGSLHEIEGHFHGFRVASGFGQHLGVSRIFCVPARVAHARGDHPWGPVEDVFFAPEAARGKHPGFRYSCSWTFFFHSSIG